MQATLNPGDRVRFPSKAGGQVVLITGTIVDHEKNNELRVGILPDRGQRDAGGSPISHKVVGSMGYGRGGLVVRCRSRSANDLADSVCHCPADGTKKGSTIPLWR